MLRDLHALANTRFDLLVIGGGILGAGIARDAALRGLQVALVEQADFASGTSSRSTKLIHGGFRYLEQGAFGLVAESCRERRILQTIAPHLVKPVALLLAIYEGNHRPFWQVRVGMTLYDILAAYRNPGRHQTYSAQRALAAEPQLAPGGLQGAVQFYDCQEDDARFCIDNIFDAAARGAVCANYCGATDFVVRNDRVEATRVTEGFEIRARVVVNAAGPWIHQVQQRRSAADDALALSPTKGVHLVTRRLTNQYGVFFQARRDGRLLFVVPWLDGSIVGSTDTDYQGDPAAAHTEPADIEYLVSEVRQLLPGANFHERDIITTFAGVRPLLKSGASPSARSREHRLVRQGANFLSIAGGKYTTYRAMAAEVVNAVYRCLGKPPPRCQTAVTPLPSHRPPPAGAQLADVPDVWTSDIQYACEHELARTLADVMRRRTPLALSRHGDTRTAQQVAAVMATVHRWDQTERDRQVRSYLDERARGTL